MGYTIAQLQSMGAKPVSSTQSASTNAFQSFLQSSGISSAPVKNISPISPAAKSFIDTGAGPGGTAPKQGVAANFFDAGTLGNATKDALGNMLVKPAAELGVGSYDIAKDLNTFGKTGQLPNELLPSKDLPLGIGKVTPPNPNTPQGFIQVAQDTLSTLQNAMIASDAVKNMPELPQMLNDLKTKISDFGSKAGDTLSAVGEKLTPVENAPRSVTLSPEQQDIQNNITQTQKEVQQAKAQADFATEQRKTATPQAVQGVRDVNTKVTGNLKTLGEQFGNDAAKLEQGNPNLKLNLTNEQVDALSSLKENKNFSLPEKIQQAQDAQANLPQSKFGTIKLTGKALEDFNVGQKATQVSLSPTEAQDLIKELNRSTFRQNTDGSITKDYQRLGITNDIKKSASEAFGESWDKIYSKYSQGRGMIDKLDSIVNLDSKATPEDLNKQLEGILKQSKTPEGKLLLQQAIDEYKQSSGVDLNDPIKSIQQVADHQTVLDEANSSLSDAQKASAKAQREADIAQLKQEQRMSTFKGRHPQLSNNMNYFVKRAAWGLTGGAVIGALGLSAILKKVAVGK